MEKHAVSDGLDRFSLADPGIEESLPSSDVRLAQQILGRADLHGEHGGAHRERFGALLALGVEALERTHLPAHITASAMVVEPDERRVLVLHHRKLRRWLQPGGHADANADLVSVAAREVAEETGVGSLRVVVPAIHLDIHEVRPPGEEPHLHYDIRFAATCRSLEVRTNHESTDHRWVTPEELSALQVDPGLLVLAALALRAVDALRRDPTG